MASLILAALAIMGAAVELGGTSASRSPSGDASHNASDPLAATLERCGHLTPEQAGDAACRRAWAESRRRFLGNYAGQGV